MPSPATIDIGSLLKPVKGEFPAGKHDPMIDNEVKELRKEQDPANFLPTDPNRPKSFQPPKWPEIIRLCKEHLVEKSKYPSVPAFLAEALIRTQGMPGARDGFKLLKQWTEEYLEKLYPPEQNPKYIIEEYSDFDKRLQGINFIENSEQDKSLREAPLIRYTNAEERLDLAISYDDLKPTENQTPKISETEFSKLLVRIPDAVLKQSLENLEECQNELNVMLETVTRKSIEVLKSFRIDDKVLDDKTAAEMVDKKVPGLTRCKNVLIEAKKLLQAKMEEKAGLQPAEVPGAAGVVGAGVKGGAAGFGQSRDQLYEQLRHIAAQLEKIDAHSPVPLLILKAVQLREMKFPKLVELLNSDARVLQFITQPEEEKK